MVDKIKTSIGTFFSVARGFFGMDNVVLIVLVVLAFIWSVGSIGVLNRNYNLQKRVDQANLDNQILQLQNQNLKLQQAYYQTDEFLGLQARALLGKANAGEHLVLLPQQNELPTTSSIGTSAATTTTTKSNSEQWFEFLFGAK